MMWRCGGAALRLMRRRLVLAVIFVSSLSYCIISLLRDNNNAVDSEVQDIVMERKHPFIWRTLQEHNETTVESTSCRNSIQGKVLVVDDRGFVCHRPDVLSSGCCNSLSHTTKQYSCATCSEGHCCVIYEYCVACCLHPDKKEILEAILDKVSVQHNVLFASVNDHFELCLAKCRTNSQSVHHENSYRDPKRKHCFGEDVPGS
ncbi:SREBP regulating gene protein [Arctopsyche grandis]|uniref:SREBP regulating gene protein n=1 Tax=Arctopsyche grandis TaxID=121162 RepID=UPI00406D75A9